MTTEERIANLEQRLARMESERVIHARELLLEDENGKVRAMLSAAGSEPGLRLYDEKDMLRATLDATESGPGGLFLYDAKGKLRAALGMTEDVPGVWLFDGNGKVIWSAPAQRQQLT